MAINALTGRDSAMFGTAEGNAQVARLYPQWMRDARQRGIGVAEDFTPTTPQFIDIPHGPLTSSNALAPQQTFDQPAPYVPFGDANWNESHGEGGGAGGGNTGGPQGFDNGGQPGNLQSLLGPVLDYFGLGGTPADKGDIANDGKVGDYGATNQLGGGYGGMGDFGSKGDIDNGSKSGDFGAMNGGIGGDAAGGGGGGEEGGGGGGDQGGGGGENGGADGGSGSGGMFKGGIVTRNKLQGPDPAGPDDGSVPMDVGEGVLTAKAIKYYGPGIVARLNKLQVPKGAFSKR